MTDERLKKSAGDNRTSRAMEGRAVTENREITDDERVEMFRLASNRSLGRFRF